MIRIPAAVTQILGALISVVVGYNVALIAASMFENFTQNSELYPLVYWPSFVFVTLSCFFAGLEEQTPAGWNSVLTAFGARVRGIVLGEGIVWVIPFLMGRIPVDCRILIREQLIKDNEEKDLPLSKDGLAMWSKFLLIFRVVDPYQWLEIEDALHGLYDIAEKIIRDAIADEKANKLRTSSQKSHLSRIITQALRNEAHHYGIEILEAAVPVMRLPEDYEKALARIPIEKAERKAERIQNEAVIEFLKQLQDDGKLEPRDAMASIQIERGKVTANRHIYSVEGSEEIANAVANALERIFARSDA